MAGRVLFISENAPVPSDRRVWNEARALRDAGWEVVVVCAQGETRNRRLSEVVDGIAIHRYPLAAAGGGVLGYVREYAQAVWRIRRLARRLARERPFDVVHAANPPDFLLLAVRSLRRQGARLVFDHHDLVPELFRAKYGDGRSVMHRAALALERLGLRTADVVIATNESYREVALRRGGRRPEDVFVVRNGPDLERFRPGQPDPGLKRGRRFLIGYLGIMGPQDGVDHALRALAWLRARRDDWHAVLAGDGECLEQMRALAAELGIADRVEFAGWCDDEQIRTLLSTCDVCLAPDPPTPFNDRSTMIKIPEYLAIGCPVVSYALRESQVSAGSAAVYARPGDPDDLGAHVDDLLGDPQRRAAMRAAGQAAVAERLAWQHQVPRLLDAYARACGTAPAPAPAQSAAQAGDGRLVLSGGGPAPT